MRTGLSLGRLRVEGRRHFASGKGRAAGLGRSLIGRGRASKEALGKWQGGAVEKELRSRKAVVVGWAASPPGLCVFSQARSEFSINIFLLVTATPASC